MEKHFARSLKHGFKEDKIHLLIKRTIQKNPVNSEFFNVSKVAKNYQSKKKIDPNSKLLKMDPREFLSKVGFSNGRLHEKNWVENLNHDKETRIQAPGPTLHKLNQDSDIDQASSEVLETSPPPIQKKLKNFKLAFSKLTNSSSSPVRAYTARTTSRLTSSQQKSKEYLCFAKNLNKQERKVIKSQTGIKQKLVEEQVEKDAAKTERTLNKRGIFSKEINKVRVQSMIPIKITSQNRIRIDPLKKIEKERILSLRLGKWENKNPGLVKESVGSDQKNKVLEMLCGILTKQDYNGKKSDSFAQDNEDIGGGKSGWIERINKTVSQVLNKTKLDDRMLRIMAL